MVPGEYLLRDGDIEINPDREVLQLRVDNTGDRPIQIGSHTHFFEVNRALRFDRDRAYGRRLNVPAGTSLRFEPGEARDITLIPLAGRRIARGMSGLVNGPLDPPSPLRGFPPSPLSGFGGAGGEASTP
jgi:urease beta subunit